MNMDFANGMRAAMRLMQAKKLVEATRVIQSALSGRKPSAPPANQAENARAIEGRVIDLAAEVVEAEVDDSGRGRGPHWLRIARCRRE